MKKIFGVLTIVILFISCSKENDTSKEVASLPNQDKYQNLANAINNIDVKSKVSPQEQMVTYLDDKYDNFNTEYVKVKSKQKSTLTHKGTSADNTYDLDAALNSAGITEIQKEFIAKTNALFPLDKSDDQTAKTDSLDVEKIKLGLLNVRGEVTDDIRLNSLEKEQLYSYIDAEYITLGSVVNYVENVNALNNNTTKRFSFRKFVNQVFSIVVGVVVGVVLGSGGGIAGSIAGGVLLGGLVAHDVFHNNTCIKICGIGSCSVGFFTCD
jgi:hypothetical protein